MSVGQHRYEVRYVDAKGATHQWSRHRSMDAAKRAFREPLNQLDAQEVFLVAVRENVILDRATR